MTIHMRSLALTFLFLGVLRGYALDVVYIDKGKEIEIRAADAEESPEGLTIKKGTAFEITYVKAGMTTRRDAKPTKVTFPLKVSPMSVKDFQLRDADVAPVQYLLEYRPPLSLIERSTNPAIKDPERVKMYRESLPLFEALKPRVQANTRLKRHLEFKYAETLYRLSETLYRLALVEPKDEKTRTEAEEARKEAEVRRGAAITALAAYQKDRDNANGFQVGPALMMLAQLQEDSGDLNAVQKTYQDLAAVPGLSEELKVSSLINAARTLMKLGKYGEAQTGLTALKGNLGADSPYASKVQLYLAQCQLQGDNTAQAAQAEKDLRQILAGTDDKSVKALAHNTLGDYYSKLKQDEEAFWEYLRVDTLFGEADRGEHARALYHLIRLFREVKKDADRSMQVEELLTKDPRFTGLEYQKKALKK
jgi:tetratricopeptide (TPR) repeat protein